ncbi:MAG: 16S rRNA (cytosine(1402)-N(4))-methyltransferase, partial [Actinobacteria bacterium]|nr:16S rRNA (cytosine(1402)-N(4))-methyltransferase [Actinomycetota bacterium]
MMSAPEFAHVPVMRDEIVALFASVPRGFVLDATLGGAGHAVALLEAHEHLSILGVDRDPNALAAARARLNVYADRVRTSHRRFDDIDGALDDAEVSELSGALFDLGVSSHQFDAPERGFSYRQSAPLDMRMNPGAGETAAALAHEVRNPLGAITLFLSMLKSDVEDRPQAVNLVDEIERSIASLDHVVSNVLHFAKGKKLQSGPVNVHSLLREVHTHFANLYA